MRKKLPFFVYGTLLHGCSNYDHFLKGWTVEEKQASASGTLYAVENNAFPCLCQEGSTPIYGEIMYVTDESYDNILQRLDWLEDYDESNEAESEYVRRITTVQDNNGQNVEVYIYYWNRSDGLGERIKSGCWRTFLNDF
ncbi:gamma-glutamylcyclotransferase [Alteribacillus sp. HJP-4]|uniref:gamma-glutamylcyclotransferase family protein n=1 Tax=Alteribacillus sp. HJP-4 TaxID=2775394 RepID=UPI0035CD20D7